jgi:hypothetical protein
LLHEEEWAPEVGCVEVVEVIDRVVGDACGFADSSVEHEHIQTIADEGTNLLGNQRGAVGRCEIHGDCVGAAASGVDLSHQ